MLQGAIAKSRPHFKKLKARGSRVALDNLTTNLLSQHGTGKEGSKEHGWLVGGHDKGVDEFTGLQGKEPKIRG